MGVALLGLVFLGGGIVAVFLTDNGPGSAALVTLGALAFGVAIFSDRIESIELGGAKLKLRTLARQRFALASKREQEGDVKAASMLQNKPMASSVWPMPTGGSGAQRPEGKAGRKPSMESSYRHGILRRLPTSIRLTFGHGLTRAMNRRV